MRGRIPEEEKDMLGVGGGHIMADDFAEEGRAMVEKYTRKAPGIMMM